MRKNAMTKCAAGAMLIGCTLGATSAAQAALVVGWTIPSALTGTLTGTSYSVGVANQGDSTVGSNLRGVHASASTAWSSPVGNGSQYSFASNTWAAGDYYEVSFSAANYQDLSITWDQGRSSSGPTNWKMQVSVGGATFVDVLPSYAIVVSASSNTWNSTTPVPLSTRTQALGADANGASDVRIRFVANNNPGFTSGTVFMDNIMVNGTQVPAPGALALLGAAGLIGTRRRR